MYECQFSSFSIRIEINLMNLLNIKRIKTGLIFNFTILLIAISLSLSSSFVIGTIKDRLAKKSWVKGD
jgi:hypothetical protein